MLQTLFESQFKAQIYVQQKYIVTMDLGKLFGKNIQTGTRN